MIAFSCPACRKKLAVKEALAGKKAKCSSCGRILLVPAAVATPAGDAEPRTILPATKPARQAPAPVNADGLPTEAGPIVPEATRNPEAKDVHPDSSLIDFLSPPQANDELGRLGKYRILKVLGHGGMGVVYKAEDPVLQRAVAIKAMLPSLAASASASKRFLREAQTMAAGEHDHIVRILDVCEDRSVPFLAMEFLKGEPLDVRIERDGKLAAAEVVRIGKEIASGLQAAHERGLIHRDIKPGNIWLETPRGRVKILDFGLARSAEQSSALTQQGAIMGTPAYMAPEQARGEPLDARSDLFSLGVVLYRLCSGCQPFQGRDAISTLMAVATAKPPPPRSLNAEMPPELSDLVMNLLQKEPDHRPASAEVVVMALQELETKLIREQEARERTEALPDAAKRTAAPRKRPRWLALVGVAALMLMGLLTAVVVISLRTKNGTLEVTVSEPGVQVLIDGDKKVVLESKKTGRIELIPGEPRLTVKRGNEELYTESFTLKSGGVVVIDAKWTPRAVVAPKPSRDEAWFKAVAAMHPDDQVTAVAGKLKALNPGFDGKLTHKIDKAAVAELSMSGSIKDISPVRVLTALRALTCRNAPLSDLSPLTGLRLTRLDIGGTQVSDLSPLKDMPLTSLRCGGTKVTELSLLKGMSLQELQCDLQRPSDADLLRSLPTLATINDIPAAQFWRNWEAKTRKVQRPPNATLNEHPSTVASATLKGHTSWVYSVAFSLDGKTLASGSHDSTIKLWDVASGQEKATLKKGEKNSSRFVVTFSSNGKTLASGSPQTTIKLWDVASGIVKGTKAEWKCNGEYGKTNVSHSAQISLSAQHSLAFRNIRIKDLKSEPTGALPPLNPQLVPAKATLRGHISSVDSVTFSPDGKTLASGSQDNTIKLWEVASGREKFTLEERHRGQVQSLAFSPDGKTLASGSNDQTIKLWDVASGRVKATLTGHTKIVHSVAFSPDGKILASGSWDHTIKLWDVASGQLKTTLKGHTDWLFCVAFSPDGKMLASGSVDNTIKLWDVASGQEKATIKGHTRSVKSVAFSPDGKMLASGSVDNTIKLWDVAEILRSSKTQ